MRRSMVGKTQSSDFTLTIATTVSMNLRDGPGPKTDHFRYQLRTTIMNCQRRSRPNQCRRKGNTECRISMASGLFTGGRQNLQR
jgi:hypothetical protein